MQKYTFDPETHKMTMVLEYELCDFMFETARIGHQKTYDMRVVLHFYTQSLQIACCCDAHKGCRVQVVAIYTSKR